MKNLLEIFRSVLFFAFGASILIACIGVAFNELLLDFKGVEAEVKILNVAKNVSCGGRKVKRICNHFTLEIDGKPVVYSSDDNQISESKLTYLKDSPHIFKMGIKNDSPIKTLFDKSLNFFPLMLVAIGIFGTVVGQIGINSAIKNRRLSFIVSTVFFAFAAFLGWNVQNFFA